MTRPLDLKKRRVFADINLIPLIDVALVLVIIMMVITPFLLRSQIEVNIPKSSSTVPGQDQPLELTITRSGHIFMGTRQVSWDNLERELGFKIKGKPLLIQADKAVELDKIVRVMDIAKRLKVGKLGIAAIPSGT
ncbi:MAG: biopolymer transporter ExbD [Elusimicrobia bacterium]|nr:biopolymer transporter ExbD [Elusimicrobiota bacterium]